MRRRGRDLHGAVPIPAAKNGTDATALEIKRQGSPLTLSVEPERNEQGICCIGAWIRDSMAGIGTVTYYDPATGDFGALGHGITDGDTMALMPFGSGSILPSTVKAVKKGSSGSAGELRGNFDLSGDLGPLCANTDCGIFGTLPADCTLVAGEALPVGDAVEGPATIRANVSGDEVREYAVEILKRLPNASDGREMVISVTDPDLIAATGGIVQG
ncbi:MAG: SpoIVB peptidase S55 domain-containing protein, partial [Dysosmobacter sp.]